MELVYDSNSFILKIYHLTLKECICTLKILKSNFLHFKEILWLSNHLYKISFISNMFYTLKYLKWDFIHLKKNLKTLKSFKQDLSIISMIYTLKFMKSYILHPKSSLKTLKSFKQDFFHLKHFLYFQIHQVKSSTLQEKY